MDRTEICFLPATELVSRFRRRELSPVAVTEAVLERIEQLNPTLGAYCTVTADGALLAARAAEAAYLRGDDAGALGGVPVSIKDLTATRGIRTTRGSLLFKDYVPDFDPPLVERLRAAGAVILGKTNTPEFGWKGVTDNRLFPPTRNPWNVERTPGGSSGGAGAAVAAGLGPLAIGTDGGGSIRIPSSFCGIFGLKPSFGLVPQYPTSGAHSVSHAGPITRTVADAALMLDVIAGPDARDRDSIPRTAESYSTGLAAGVRGLRVAWSPDLGYAPAEPEVIRICQAAAKRFAELGCIVEEANPELSDPADLLRMIFLGGLGGTLKANYEQVRDQLDPGLAAQLDEGRSVTAVDYVDAMLKRAALWDQIRGFMDRYDLLLTPTIATAAFELGRLHPETVAGQKVSWVGWTPFTYPFNLTGQPAATVPAGFTADGLPVGLQIVGRRWDDLRVLHASAAFEQLAPWAQRRPEVATPSAR